MVSGTQPRDSVTHWGGARPCTAGPGPLGEAQVPLLLTGSWPASLTSSQSLSLWASHLHLAGGDYQVVLEGWTLWGLKTSGPQQLSLLALAGGSQPTSHLARRAPRTGVPCHAAPLRCTEGRMRPGGAASYQGGLSRVDISLGQSLTPVAQRGAGLEGSRENSVIWMRTLRPSQV